MVTPVLSSVLSSFFYSSLILDYLLKLPTPRTIIRPDCFWCGKFELFTLYSTTILFYAGGSNHFLHKQMIKQGNDPANSQHREHRTDSDSDQMVDSTKADTDGNTDI